ncbi:hypothetical protein DFH06DRAFT_1126699 [Mycena polygramma]|nr:hypothetical protein DFH06DRAFT_1126699 [Mycena polygramma]
MSHYNSGGSRRLTTTLQPIRDSPKVARTSVADDIGHKSYATCSSAGSHAPDRQRRASTVGGRDLEGRGDMGCVEGILMWDYFFVARDLRGGVFGHPVLTLTLVSGLEGNALHNLTKSTKYILVLLVLFDKILFTCACIRLLTHYLVTLYKAEKGRKRSKKVERRNPFQLPTINAASIFERRQRPMSLIELGRRYWRNQLPFADLPRSWTQQARQYRLNGDPFLASLPLLLLIAVVSRPLPLLYGVKLNGKLQIYSKPAMRWQERRPTSLRTEQEPRFEDKMQELQMHVLDWRQRACRREAGIWAGVKQELTRVMLQPFKSTKCNSSA